jgi:hypothetical protein
MSDAHAMRWHKDGVPDVSGRGGSFLIRCPSRSAGLWREARADPDAGDGLNFAIIRRRVPGRPRTGDGR